MIRAKLNLEQGMVRIKTLVVALIIVLLAVGGWMGYSAWRESVRNNPRTSADDVVSLMASKNADASYDMLSKTYKESSTKEEWESWIDFAFADVAGEPSFVRDFPIENPGDIYGKDSNPVRYIYSFTIKGKAYQVPFVFIREDGAWKLAEIGSPIK